MNVAQFVKRNLKKIMEKVEKNTQLIWSGRTYEDLYAERRSFTKKYPTESQKKVIGQCVDGLSTGSVFLAGEPGVGKTLMAIYTALALQRKERKGMRVLVVTPDRLVNDPWTSHVREITGKSPIVIKSLRDFVKIKELPERPKDLEFVIVPESLWKGQADRKKVKLFHKYSIKSKTNEKEEVEYFFCPDCLTAFEVKPNKVILISDKKEMFPGEKPEWSPDSGSKVRKTKVGKKTYYKIKKGESFCPFCKEFKSQKKVKRNKDGTIKYPLSDYYKDYLKRHFQLVIVDEGSLYRNPSKRGLTLGKIKTRILILSGTFMTGYVSSLFYPLMQVKGKEFRERGFTFSSLIKFQRAFGYTKAETVEKDEKQFRRFYQAPGVKPEFLAIVRKFTAFINLEDLERDLPPIKYEKVPCESPEKMLEEYKKVKSGNTRKIHALVINGLFSPDLMFREFKLDKTTTILPAVDSEEELLPKEKKLIEILRKEKEEGRKCLIYVIFTHKRDVSERLIKILKENGIKASRIPKNVEPEDREKFLKSIAKTIDAVILQPQMIFQGTNLQEYPTIIWYQPTYDTDLFKQASRRSYRFDQDREVRVYMMYYEKTIQEKAFKLLTEKTAVSDVFEGKLSETLRLAEISKNKLVQELAKELLKN